MVAAIATVVFVWMSGTVSAQDIALQATDANGGTFATDDAGNYLIAVEKYPSDKSSIVKYASDGSLEWTYMLDGVNDVAVASDGAVYAAGTDRLVRLAGEGTLEWDVVYAATITDLTVQAEGALLVASIEGPNRLRVERYSQDGDVSLLLELEGVSRDLFSFDLAPVVSPGANGDFYVAGQFNGTVDFDPDDHTFNLVSNGDSDIFVASYDSNGELVDAIGLGSTGPDAAHDLVVQDGSVYVTGFFEEAVDFDPGPNSLVLHSPGCYDAFVAKYGLDLSFDWAKDIGGAAGCAEANGFSVAVDDEGNSYLTGYFFDFQGDRVDFDPGPNIQNVTYASEEDAFIASFAANGDYRWAYGISSTLPAHGLAVTTSGADDVDLLVFTCSDATFDPGPAVVAVDSGCSLVVATYDFDGKLPSNAQDLELPGGSVQLSAYPNPAAAHLVVEVSPSYTDHVTVAVYDLLGRLQMEVYHGRVAGERSFHLDLSDLPSGTYQVRVSGDRAVTARTFIRVR